MVYINVKISVMVNDSAYILAYNMIIDVDL